MKKRSLLQKAVFLIVIAIACNSVFSEQIQTEPSNLIELKTAIQQLVEENEIPAVSIAMVDQNGPVWIGSFGKANIEHNIDADENTLFRIASTSKMFVALSVLKLIEEDKLSLSDKLSDLAPEIVFENKWRESDPIRIVHLLEHTTGWDDIHAIEYAHNDPTPATLKQGLDFHPHSRVSRWKPGSRMSYNNAGPSIAAYIVEKITGIKFEDYVQENFFDPMGMSTTSYFLSDDVKTKGATLYANGNQPQEYWHLIMRPTGAINSSATEMAQFVKFFINRGLVDGKQLVSQASLQRMETVKSTDAAKAGQETGYGLNNYSSPHKNWVYREHGGSMGAGFTEFSYLPAASLGHVIMTNSDDYSSFIEVSKLIRDYETRNLSMAAIRNDIAIPSVDQKIGGLYYPINIREQARSFFVRTNIQRIWFEGDKLVHKGLFRGEATYYYPVSPGLYKSEQTGLISLSVVNDALDGEVVHIDSAVLKSVSSWLVYSQLAILAIWICVTVSSLLFFLIWSIRKLLGEIPGNSTITIRLWPLLAGISMSLFAFLYIKGTSGLSSTLGKPSIIPIGIMLSTISFAFFAILGVYTSIKTRHIEMNRGTYWYSTFSSLIHLTLVIYLWSFGVIGLMTWV
jgi:CubicO group peptidase (beta-lactamase class C family)